MTRRGADVTPTIRRMPHARLHEQFFSTQQGVRVLGAAIAFAVQSHHVCSIRPRLDSSGAHTPEWRPPVISPACRVVRLTASRAEPDQDRDNLLGGAWTAAIRGVCAPLDRAADG